MWYVIQTGPGREFIAVEKILSEAALEDEKIFTMTSIRMIREGKNWVKRKIVAFPKYIFAETDDIEGLMMRLKNVKEMTKVLKEAGGERPAALTPKEEQLLKHLGGESHNIDVSEGYMTGDRLIISGGPMMGMSGDIRWINRRQHTVGVAVSLMGQEVVVKLGLEYVEKG